MYYTITTLVMWPTAQPKTAVIITFVVYKEIRRKGERGEGREDIRGYFWHICVIKPMHNSRISRVSNSTTKDHQVYMVHSVVSASNTLSHSV